MLCANEGKVQSCKNQSCSWQVKMFFAHTKDCQNHQSSYLFVLPRRTFCENCINNVFLKPLAKFEECYLCNPEHLQYTAFAVKNNWRRSMLDRIKDLSGSKEVHILKRLENKKDGIVVISLFDGISTGNNLEKYDEVKFEVINKT